eukprot:1379710-Alexandrium_andersonii.AAC.1
MGVRGVKRGAHCLSATRTARASHSVLNAGSPMTARNRLRSACVAGTPKYSRTPRGPDRTAPTPHGEASVAM